MFMAHSVALSNTFGLEAQDCLGDAISAHSTQNIWRVSAQFFARPNVNSRDRPIGLRDTLHQFYRLTLPRVFRYPHRHHSEIGVVVTLPPNMKTSRCARLPLALLTTLWLVLTTGCATSPGPTQPAPAPPTAEERAQFGPVMVRVQPAQTGFSLPTPTAKRKAAKDAATGLGLGPVMGVGLAAPPAVVYALVWAPAGLLIGGTYGAVAGESEQTITNATRALKATTGRVCFEDQLRDALLGHVPLLAPAPSDPLEPSPNALAEPNDGTVLEIQVGRPGLVGRSGFNPSLAFNVDVKVRLVTTRDHRELWHDALHYRGTERRTYAGWAGSASDGQPLQAELARAAQSMSEEIAAQVFTRTTPGDAAAATALARRGLLR
jgi:hypothetical protein